MQRQRRSEPRDSHGLHSTASLTFEGETPPAYTAALERGGFQEVVLEAPPLSVNIIPNLPKRDNNYGIESLVPGALVVPVLEERKAWQTKHTCASHYAATQCHVPKEVRYTGHPVTCALTVTSFKLQGATLEKLIMSVHTKPFPPHIDLEALYVFISRVRKLENLRVLSKPSSADGGLDNLLQLRHAPEMRVWEAGYDEHGDWSIALAGAQAAVERQRAAAAPTRRQPQRRHCTKANRARVAAKRRAVEGGDGATAQERVG